MLNWVRVEGLISGLGVPAEGIWEGLYQVEGKDLGVSSDGAGDRISGVAIMRS